MKEKIYKFNNKELSPNAKLGISKKKLSLSQPGSTELSIKCAFPYPPCRPISFFFLNNFNNCRRFVPYELILCG